MGRMTDRSYTVHSTPAQAERWETAAVAHGRMTVGSWLAQAADAYLEEMGKAGKRLPMVWTKGVFQARIYDRLVWPWQYRDVEVQGKISGRFGIYQGDDRGQETRNNHVHSLVHLPTRRIVATLSHHRSCRAFAGELVYLWINWDQEDPETVVQGQPDQPKVREVVARWKRKDP